MASPFSIFRKHQKIAYAILTIACMVVFVFAGPFTRSSNNPATGGRGTEVATWKFGTIYSGDVQNLRASRRNINTFFATAYADLAAKGKVPEGTGAPQYPIDENNLLNAIVLHKKAEQMGVVINDKAVNDRIDLVTQNSLTGAEKADVAARVQTGQNMHLTARQLTEDIRFELELEALADLLQSDTLEISTPEQRWDYFSRLNRRATVEVLPVAVKDFVGKVKTTPTDADLKSFFETHKNNFSSPDSPTPGFMEPVRGKFQYFVAHDDELVKEEKPKVTDDEIKQYYEKHKEQFRKSDDESADSTDKSKPADAKAPDSKTTPEAGKPGDKTEKPAKNEKQSAETKPTDTESPNAKPADTKPADAKAADAKATDAKATEPKSDNAKPADAKSTDVKSTDTKSPPDKAPPAGKSSQLDRRTHHLIREELLALADDAAPKPAASSTSDKKADSASASKPAAAETSGKDGAIKTPDAGSKPADTPAPTSKPDAAKAAKTGSSTETPPAGTTPSDAAAAKTNPLEKSAPTKGEPDKTLPAKSPSTTDGIPDLGLKPGEAPKKIPIVEYRSLDDEKVRDEIREDIAKQKVRDRIDAAFKDLSIKVTSYKRKYDSWKVKQIGDAPPPPDYLDLAKQNHVKFEETGLITAQEAQDTLAIGKSYEFSFAGRQIAQIFFTQQAFMRDLGNYKPTQTDAANPNASFLWWRVDYKDAYVPEFDKVKSQVLEGWKMVKARDLARAQAKEYADEANKQKMKLDEAFKFQPNVHVSTIGPFTWMSNPAVARDPTQPSPPRLTNLSGVDKAGEDFMRTVFRLEPGSTGVAMNQPETIVYVIQAISFEPSEQDFHRVFLSEMAAAAQKGYGTLGATAFDSERARLAKYQAIFKEFDIKQVSPSATSAGSGAAPAAPADEGDE
jgi:hypothetical protein